MQLETEENSCDPVEFHKDTERMRNFLEASGKEGGRFKKEPFRVLEVDFYCQGGPEVLAACMEKNIRRSSLTLEK